MIFTATYSPDDNKLRLYAGSRLDSELYQRVKSAGFQWAPKQDLFYATWNPVAEDLLLELASEIEDEDKSLTVRAEERSERFEGYQDRRAEDADRARTAVSAIADNIPFGQPILIGHHSERRARKDAERIKNSMRKAIKLWETSEYWASRAAGALRHAKYKELPAVRARRIKTIEAEFRKWQREQAEAEKWLSAWTRDGLTIEGARTIANYCNLIVEKHAETSSYWSAYDVLRPDEDRYKACPSYTIEQVQDKARERYPKYIAKTQRWIDHLNHRLDYEKAMLNEQGAGALLDKKPKSAKAQLPLVNYRGENGVITVANIYHRGQFDTLKQVDMTAEQYAKIYTDYKGTAVVDGSHRVRVTMVNHSRVCVFITDSKTHTKPDPLVTQPKSNLQPIQKTASSKPEEDPRAAEFYKLKELARQGVEVVSSPDLFVTPAALAQRVAKVADICPGHTVLEPSAGIGSLLDAAKACGGVPTGVEINYKMAGLLNSRFQNVRCADFLECGDDLGKFDRVIMNPPFSEQLDIQHVTHALTFLKPGGKLVAIMSSGVTFRKDQAARDFRNLISKLGGTFEELPINSFKQSGTGVSTVLLQVQSPL